MTTDGAGSMDQAEFDVVVVGSGAAGMTAALTAAHHGLRVVVIEKTDRFGGSTARSGGGLWLPGNEVLRKAGVRDTPEQARAYLAFVAGGDVTAERQRALLEHGPAMLAFVRASTPVDFAWVPGYADYYPEAPGGLAQGRSIEPVPLNGRVLGAELAHLNPAYAPAPNGITITQADYRWLSLGPRHPRAILASTKILGRAARTRLLGQPMLSLGQALAAGLRAGLLAKQIPVWLDTPMTGLQVTGGRVTGVEVTRDGRAALIRASRGVVLAAGGFERNEQMRHRYQRQPIGTQWTTGAVGNTGDAITAGEAAGAALDLMDDAWWGPAIPLSGGPYFCLAERSLPGCMLVNGAGQRFVNESAPYVNAVHAMYAGHRTGNPHIPSWLITDQRYRNSYVFAGLPPRKPLPRRWYRVGAVHRAPTVAELAGQVGHRRRPPWPRRWSGSTSSRRPAGTRTSTVATRLTTATTAIHGAGPTRASRRWTRRRSMPSRSCQATSAPRVACAPMNGHGCSAPMAPRSPGSTRPATPAPR